jgi:DNA repair exonuclease SbcCD ATPase subunit
MLPQQVVLGSDTTQNFISSNPSQRRAIIEELLGLGQFESYLERIKEARKAITKELLDVDTKLHIIKDSRNDNEARQREARRRADDAHKRQVEVRRELDKLTHEMNEAMNKMAEMEAAHDKKIDIERNRHGDATSLALRASYAQRYRQLVRLRDDSIDKIKREADRAETEMQRAQWSLDQAHKSKIRSPLEETLKVVHLFICDPLCRYI